MKLDKIFLASCAAMVLTGCTQEVVPGVEPTPGKDVVFGTSLEPSKGTRTIYGDLTTDDKGTESYPILWLNGDQVKVMSPECSRQEGTYKVSLKDESGNQVEAAAKAGTLEKVGEAGVQWGEAPTANFFSVYPATHVGTVNTANRTMRCRVVHEQNDYIHNNNGTYTALADMKAGFLYAATYGAENGKPVELRYKPLSTAIRFKLQGPTTENTSIRISKITIKAPNKALAGNFTVEFPENKSDEFPTITPDAVDNQAGGTYDHVTVYSSYEGATAGGYLTLGSGQSMELNAFIIPQKGLSIDNTWTIEVALSDMRILSRPLMASASTAEGKSSELIQGQIHRLKALPPIEATNTYNPENWMVNIPRNTYLSEISIPGSWNSMGDAQSNKDLTTQYNNGCRAFHLDTRWRSTDAPRLASTPVQENTVTSLGIANGSNAYNVYKGNNVFNQAEGKVMGNTAPSFSDALATITKEVKDNEYMVLMCTFAQNSYQPSNKSWIDEISQACASNDKVLDARSVGNTGRPLDSKHVVGDVLGKVIVIINCEGDVTKQTLPANSKCVFVNAPLTLTSNMFGVDKYNKDFMYYRNTATNSTDITLFNTQAQICSSGDTGSQTGSRGWAPSMSERQTTAGSILSWSQQNYRNYMKDPNSYKSNNWFYLGLGGYMENNNYSSVASSMNTWIDGKISDMNTGKTSFYPVGIVLINNVVTNKTVVNNILQLNNSFQKAYDLNWKPSINTPTKAHFNQALKKPAKTQGGWDVF